MQGKQAVGVNHTGLRLCADRKEIWTFSKQLCWWSTKIHLCQGYWHLYGCLYAA